MCVRGAVASGLAVIALAALAVVPPALAQTPPAAPTRAMASRCLADADRPLCLARLLSRTRLGEADVFADNLAFFDDPSVADALRSASAPPGMTIARLAELRPRIPPYSAVLWRALQSQREGKDPQTALAAIRDAYPDRPPSGDPREDRTGPARTRIIAYGRLWRLWPDSQDRAPGARPSDQLARAALAAWRTDLEGLSGGTVWLSWGQLAGAYAALEDWPDTLQALERFHVTHGETPALGVDNLILLQRYDEAEALAESQCARDAATLDACLPQTTALWSVARAGRQDLAERLARRMLQVAFAGKHPNDVCLVQAMRILRPVASEAELAGIADRLRPFALPGPDNALTAGELVRLLSRLGRQDELQALVARWRAAALSEQASEPDPARRVVSAAVRDMYMDLGRDQDAATFGATPAELMGSDFTRGAGLERILARLDATPPQDQGAALAACQQFAALFRRLPVAQACLQRRLALPGVQGADQIDEIEQAFASVLGLRRDLGDYKGSGAEVAQLLALWSDNPSAASPTLIYQLILTDLRGSGRLTPNPPARMDDPS